MRKKQPWSVLWKISSVAVLLRSVILVSRLHFLQSSLTMTLISHTSYVAAYLLWFLFALTRVFAIPFYIAVLLCIMLLYMNAFYFLIKGRGQFFLTFFDYFCLCVWAWFSYPSLQNPISHFLWILVSADVYCYIMHHCGRDQLKPVHLHWQIHSCVLSSTWSYEDDPCADHGILFLWKRWS